MRPSVDPGPEFPRHSRDTEQRDAEKTDFASMYRAHFADLIAMLGALVPSQVAEEIAQEVFTVVWQMDGFDPMQGPRRSYLRGIARNKAIDWLRRNSSKAEREGRWATMAQHNDPVDEHVCAADQAARVHAALVLLGADRRQAIALAYYGGLSYRQVAIALDVPEGTVKTRIRQGLLQLRAQLGATPAAGAALLPVNANPCPSSS